MELESAIKHCEEVAEQNEKESKLWAGGVTEAFKQKEQKLCECASEHRQLAEWLRELKEYRERIPSYNDAIKEIALSEECARAYTRGYKEAMEYCINKLSELETIEVNADKRGNDYDKTNNN